MQLAPLSIKGIDLIISKDEIVGFIHESRRTERVIEGLGKRPENAHTTRKKLISNIKINDKMHKISFDEYDDWTETQSEALEQFAFFDAAEHFAEQGVQFHQGCLQLATLDVSPCVVIDGDLIVDGPISYAFDCGLLVVTGNLTCDVFDFPFSAYIAGDLNAKSVDIDSCCDYYLTVGGNINANSVIERGHCIEVAGAINAPVIKSMMNVISVNGVHVARCAYESPE